MSDDLINLHATNDKLMPFIHLPVQSGSESILKKMNRKYDPNFYRRIIDRLKKAKTRYRNIFRFYCWLSR